MKAQEIIRDLLDLIDAINGDDETNLDLDVNLNSSELSNEDDINRFRQIAGLVNVLPDCSKFENEPKEIYLGIAAVTTDAGGGINGPKHPHDIRVKDPSMYPDSQGF